MSAGKCASSSSSRRLRSGATPLPTSHFERMTARNHSSSRIVPSISSRSHSMDASAVACCAEFAWAASPAARQIALQTADPSLRSACSAIRRGYSCVLSHRLRPARTASSLTLCQSRGVYAWTSGSSASSPATGRSSARHSSRSPAD